MRIFIREVAGGITTMFARWMRALPEAGAQVVLTRDVSRPFTPLGTVFDRGFDRVSYDGKLDNRMAVYRDLRATIRSPREHLVANDILELGMIAACRPVNPVTFFLHGDYDYYYELAVAHAAQIGSFACVSSAILQKLGELIPTRRQDMYLTYPVISDPEGSHARRDAGSPIRLLYVGRLTEEKGFVDLPEIDRHLHDLGVEARWTVIGEAPMAPPEEHGRWLARPEVTHIPNVSIDRMNDVYQANDILVFPSRYEGFGMCVAEAMKCGTVPVASRLEAGIPEMIEDGVTGFMIPPGDTLGFARRIAELSKNPLHLDQLGSSAAAFARDKFDVDKSVQAMSRAIFSASSLSGPSGPTYLSRMDKPMLPNIVVRTSRSLLNKLKRD